jgi:RHS repeat-associated protein
LYYVYTDNQGSVIALTDETGNVKRRYAYDPWGVRRNPDNWTEKDSRTTWIINRGYTGHEHLDAFGIINMNGRVYDPLTAQFFSPDPTLTDAGNWLDYNRFGYCLNNPFRYTDPSGYTWWAENGNMVITTTASIVVGGVVAIATAGVGVPAMIASGMAAGAAGGFTGGAVGTALAGGSFGDAMQAGLQGAAVGAVMGGVTAGIGSAFGPVGSIAKKTFDVWKELGRAGVHALAQGGFSAMRGGDFWQGAAAGFASSFVGSAAQGVGIHGLGMVGVSAASGGIGAAIAGGEAEDILYGMVSGAMVGMLNHAAGEKQQKTFETMLRAKLQQIKIGQSISVDELKKIGLVGTKESLAFNSIKRVMTLPKNRT